MYYFALDDTLLTESNYVILHYCRLKTKEQLIHEACFFETEHGTM